MASSLLSKLFLLITILVTILVISSKADKELMMQQCHNSENPTLCLSCLSSDPTSPEADQIGLARIILKCINSHLLNLTKNASVLASFHYLNPEAKKALKRCVLGYEKAKRGVGEADADLVAGDYEKAANDVGKKVEAPPVLCSTSLVTLDIYVPKSFHYHTEVYLALTQTLLRIIDRF